MHGLGMTVIFDLNGYTAPGAVTLRDELLGRLSDPDAKYNFNFKGIMVYPIVGGYVKIDFSRHGSPGKDWMAFSGLNVKVAEVNASGTDHFPAAGLYHSSTLPRAGIRGASAMVHWKLDHAYPLSEEVIEAVVRSANDGSDYSRHTIRLEVPVVYSRSWVTTVAASTVKKALTGYELLRSGAWKPQTPFVDTLADVQKLRLLTQAIEETE